MPKPPDPLRRIRVSETLRRMLDASTPEERDHLLEMAAYYAGQFRARFARLNGPSRANSVNLLIDSIVAKHHATSPEAPTIRCASGCCHCCYLPVDISREEALLLHEAAHHAGIPLDDAVLEARAKWEFHNWPDMPPDERKCVFLTPEGTCGVYEHRPSACRKYHVISEPSRCDTFANFGGLVDVLTTPQAEVIHVVAQSLSKERDTMPRMLLKYHPRRSKKKP